MYTYIFTYNRCLKITTQIWKYCSISNF